ncbi:MAG: phosphatase PAP2 family protein [archaeon]
MKKENNFFKNREIKSQLIILFATFILFALLLSNILAHGFLSFVDINLMSWISTHQTNFLISISKILSNIFEPIIFFIISILLALFFIKHHRKKEFISLAVFTFISLGVMELMKLLVQRPRPILSLISENTFSFPSGHTLMAVIFFGALIYLFEKHIKSNKKKHLWSICTVLLVLAISISRLILNVHYLSDVLGSLLIGTFLLTLFIISIEYTNIFKRD